MSADRRAGGARKSGPPKPVAGHVARKRFGQHFLADRAILAAIVEAIRPRGGDGILEIGPGLGVLTAELLRFVPTVAAVEIDRDLCERLRRRFGPDRLALFEADALAFDISQALAALGVQRLRVVGNLPYNISSPLMVALVGARHLVRDQHFLLQKEVVERIVAAPGSSSFGRLSVILQAFYEVELLFEVPPEAFDPPPRVDSAVLRMTVRETPLAEDLGALQSVLAPAFAQRRKMIRSTLMPWLKERGVSTDGLAGESRPEEISVERYCELARQLRSINSIL
jgi:16S rRNA (adenine1518-N6/adenine1519-N6)-dimethyltransferase